MLILTKQQKELLSIYDYRIRKEGEIIFLKLPSIAGYTEEIPIEKEYLDHLLEGLQEQFNFDGLGN